MRRIALFVVSLTLFLTLGSAAKAVQPENFNVMTTQDLVDLCNVAPSDPLYKEAIHFCHGYLVGAYHYYHAQSLGPDGDVFVCLPEQRPSRNAIIDNFLNWTARHPEYSQEMPVETEFRYLSETYPCR